MLLLKLDDRQKKILDAALFFLVGNLELVNARLGVDQPEGMIKTLSTGEVIDAIKQEEVAVIIQTLRLTDK